MELPYFSSEHTELTAQLLNELRRLVGENCRIIPIAPLDFADTGSGGIALKLNESNAPDPTLSIRYEVQEAAPVQKPESSVVIPQVPVFVSFFPARLPLRLATDSVILSPPPDAGTFTLTVNLVSPPRTTAPISYAATATDVANAINALPGVHGVTVTAEFNVAATGFSDLTNQYVIVFPSPFGTEAGAASKLTTIDGSLLMKNGSPISSDVFRIINPTAYPPDSPNIAYPWIEQTPQPGGTFIDTPKGNTGPDNIGNNIAVEWSQNAFVAADTYALLVKLLVPINLAQVKDELAHGVVPQLSEFTTSVLLYHPAESKDFSVSDSGLGTSHAVLTTFFCCGGLYDANTAPPYSNNPLPNLTLTVTASGACSWINGLTILLKQYEFIVPVENWFSPQTDPSLTGSFEQYYTRAWYGEASGPSYPGYTGPPITWVASVLCQGASLRDFNPFLQLTMFCGPPIVSSHTNQNFPGASRGPIHQVVFPRYSTAGTPVVPCFSFGSPVVISSTCTPLHAVLAGTGMFFTLCGAFSTAQCSDSSLTFTLTQ